MSILDVKQLKKNIGIGEDEYLGRITPQGEFKTGWRTLDHKIEIAKSRGFTDAQILGTLANSNYSIKIENARARGYNDRQIVNTLAGIKNIELEPKAPREGLISTLIKQEKGAIETITAPLFFKSAEKSLQIERDAQTQLLKLYRELPEGNEQKEKLGKLINKYAKEGPRLRFEEIIPTANKSTSQALGEAIMLGLLVAPGVGAARKVLTTGYTGVLGKETLKLGASNVIKDFYKNLGKGMTYGGAMGATIGLAEEGELRDKAPTIMAMAGFGMIGGGVLGGFLPPIVKLGGAGAKRIFSKVVGKIDDKIINPVIRYIERPVSKLGTERAINPIGLSTIEKDLTSLNKKIYQVYNRIDTMFYAGKTKKQITPVAKELSKLQTRVKIMENRRTALLNKSMWRDLKQGDEIFSKDIGRVKIKEFQSDLDGKFFVIGEDRNGKIVTVMPDDVLKAKKILPQNMAERAEIIGLPKVLEQPVKLGKFQKAMFGINSFIQTSSKMIGNMGPSGKAFVQTLSNLQNTLERRVGQFKLPMKRVIRRYGLDKKAPLTALEKRNIVDILDAGIKYKAKTLDDIPIKPINDRVRDFVNTFSKATSTLRKEFNEAGGYIKDRATGRKYQIGEIYMHLPHIPKDIEKLKAAAPEIIENILMKRHKLSKPEATRLLNNYIKSFGANRYAGLEQSRTLMIEGFEELEKYGYETNPLVIFNDFIEGGVKRLEEVKAFGRNNEVMANLIHQVGQDGYDKGLVEKLWNTYTGDRAMAATHKDLAKGIKTWQVIAKLPLGAIVNATQPVNTASEFGVKNTFKGFKRFLTDKVGAEEAARLAGVSDSMITKAMEMAGAESKVAGTYLRKVGFTSVEKFNRVISVVAGQEWAESALKTLIKNPNDPRIIRHFNRLGIDDVGKAISRGRFTQEELNIIGQKAAHSTQFRGSVLDVPLLWSSKWGKVATQFKSFAWQQGAFVKREIIDEAAAGNVAPLITYLISSQLTGEAVRDIKDVLKGDLDFRQDESVISRLIDNQMTVGGFGLTGELFEQMFQRASGKRYITAADFIAGPTVAEVSEFIDSAADMFGGNFNSITGWASRDAALLSQLPKIKNVPGAGAYLRIFGDILRTIQKEAD